MDTQPRIETRGSFEFVGVAWHGDPRTDDLHRAWSLFGEVADTESIHRIGRDVYGLQIYHPQFPARFELTYMACLIREPGMVLPLRMISKQIPDCKYAVQKVQGGVAGIDETLEHLYRVFIPNTGYRVALPLDFERYCDVQDHERCPNEIEVWVPIKDA